MGTELRILLYKFGVGSAAENCMEQLIGIELFKKMIPNIGTKGSGGLTILVNRYQRNKKYLDFNEATNSWKHFKNNKPIHSAAKKKYEGNILMPYQKLIENCQE